LVEAAVEAALDAAKRAVTPDVSSALQLKKTIDRITAGIQFLMKNPGDSEADRLETEQQLKALRADRTQKAAELAALEASKSAPQRLPTSREIRTIVSDLRAVLTKAADPLTPETSLALRALLQNIIERPIMLSQTGNGPRSRLTAHMVIRLDRLDPTRIIEGVNSVKVDVDLVNE